VALAKRYGSVEKARASFKKKGGGGEYLWRLKADESFTVRFLQEIPDWVGAFQHYIGGEFVWCTDPEKFKECPHCKDGDRPAERALANVLDRESGQVRILQMTKQLADSVAGRGKQPVTTADYEIWREGSSKENTKYGADRMDPTKISLSRYTLHDIEAALVAELGFDPDSDEEEEEEEEPRSSKKKPSRPSRRSRDEEDDEDEDEEDEEDDEEEEAPRRPMRRTSSAKPAVKKKPRRDDGYDEFKPEKSRHPEAVRARKLRSR
jgi:hypothetical protein